MQASGTSGELRVGYQAAIWLGAWSIALEHRLPAAYTFTAQVLRRHDFWSTQRPLTLVLRIGDVEWTWRGIEPQYVDPDTMQFELAGRPAVAVRQQPQGAAR